MRDKLLEASLTHYNVFCTQQPESVFTMKYCVRNHIETVLLK